MKIYKTYFDKSDTPFVQEFQPKRKYHVVWKRQAYKSFLGHNVVKVKVFGLFRPKKTEHLNTIIKNIINSNQ